MFICFLFNDLFVSKEKDKLHRIIELKSLTVGINQNKLNKHLQIILFSKQNLLNFFYLLQILTSLTSHS